MVNLKHSFGFESGLLCTQNIAQCTAHSLVVWFYSRFIIVIHNQIIITIIIIISTMKAIKKATHWVCLVMKLYIILVSLCTPATQTSGICLMNKAWNYKISSCFSFILFHFHFFVASYRIYCAFVIRLFFLSTASHLFLS